MTINIILIVVSILITFPLAHVFMKKALVFDYDITEERLTDLSKFFYIPYLNVVITFFYLLWTIVKFKRPE